MTEQDRADAAGAGGQPAPFPSESPKPRGSVVEQMVDHAIDMLREGKRPTLDLLLALRGTGSRSTAQQALTILYGERLPAMLAQQDGELPEALLSAVRYVWESAQVAASESSKLAIAEARREVEGLRDALQEQLQAIDQEREAARAEVAAAMGRADNAEAIARGAEAAQAEAEAALAALQERHDRLASTLEQLRVELEAATEALARANESRRLEAEQAAQRLREAQEAAVQHSGQLRQEADEARRALIAAHESALSELKAAYVDSESRLRVEIDGLKTRCKQLDAEIDRQRRKLAEADAALAEAARREEEAKRARRPWLRPGRTPTRRR